MGVKQEKICAEIQRFTETELASLQEDRVAGVRKVHIDQGFISRVLTKKVPTLNKRMIFVCKYVEIFDISVEHSSQSWPPSKNLIEALGYAWDGSSYQEKMLCRLLRAINGMGGVGRGKQSDVDNGKV